MATAAAPAGRLARVAAVGLFVLVTCLTAAGLLLTALARESLWPNGAAAMVILAFPVVGVLIAWRRPRNSVAWLCLTIGLLWGLEGAGWGAALYGFAHPGRVARPEILAVVADALVMPGLFLMATLLLLVFPDGHLPSPRWGWLAWLTTIAIVTAYAFGLFLPETSGWERPTVENPLTVESLADVDLVVVPVLFLCVVASVVALMRRYRRSTGTERLQLKWLAASGASAVVMWAIAILVVEHLAGEDAAVAVTTAAFVLIPVAIGVAVLRYRLFEINRLISRTVAYALVVGVLVAVYAGGVLGLRGLFPLQSDLAIAASTLAVAALFNPLRSRVRRGVDRRFNRSHYDTERELERFASRLRDELDLGDVIDDVIAVVTSTVQPTTASLWIPADRRSRPARSP